MVAILVEGDSGRQDHNELVVANNNDDESFLSS
jgi:hypothetical protein